MRSFLSGFLGGLCALALLGAAWTSGYEAIPSGTDLASDLDLYINGFKTEVRQRLEVEHQFGGSTGDNGLHAIGSARCFTQATAPTDINAATGVLGQYNSAAASDGGTDLTTEELGASTSDIGAGRCWIDTDDFTLYVWNETTNAWVPAQEATAAGMFSSLFGPGKANLVYNGQFETTDGTGSTTSTAAPVGWTAVSTPTLAYAASPGAQGDGLTVNVTAAGGANEGLSQTLKGLKGSTIYYAVARATPGIAADSCSIRTTGAGTDVGAAGTTHTIAAGTSATTIYGFFTTDATPTDVVLILESDVDGDLCKFDYVGVYETAIDRKSLPDPKVEIASVTNATDDPVSTTESIVQDATGDWIQAVTVPRPGYSILVLVDLSAVNTGGNCPAATVNLQEDIDAGGFADVRTAPMNVDGQSDNGGSIELHWMRANPNAGSKYSYQLTFDCDQGTATINGDNTNAGGGDHDTNSQFSVLLIPTG